MFWHEGVGFRPIEERDLELIRELRNEPTTWMSLTTVGQISTGQQQTWFEGLVRDSSRAYYTAVKEYQEFPVSSEGEFLGIVRMDEIDRINRSIRVGLDIIPEKRGQGYGTRLMRAIIKYCFDMLNMHRVWLCVLDNNEVARKLYNNTGFKTEGIEREAVFRDGRYHDYHIMSILENEYRHNLDEQM